MARKLKAIESKALPKGGNSILNNAKYSSANTDEWYTTYETIAEGSYENVQSYQYR